METWTTAETATIAIGWNAHSNRNRNRSKAMSGEPMAAELAAYRLRTKAPCPFVCDEREEKEAIADLIKQIDSQCRSQGAAEMKLAQFEHEREREKQA